MLGAMGEDRWLLAPRMNGARGWVRVRRAYALTAVVVAVFVTVEAGLLHGARLVARVDDGAATALYVLATAGAFTLLPFVAVCALGYQGLRRGLGVAPLLVGAGLWASLCLGLGERGWLPLVALALLPGVAALATHPCRDQVGSAAR
jgi:hypothetical protein